MTQTKRDEIINTMNNVIDEFFESLKKNEHPEVPNDPQEVKNILNGIELFLRNYVPLFIYTHLNMSNKYPDVLVKYCQRLERMQSTRSIKENYLFDLNDYYTVKSFYQDNLDEFSLFMRSLIFANLLPYNFNDKDFVMIDFAGDKVTV